MKKLDEIAQDTRVQVTSPWPEGCGGYLNLRTGKQRTFSFIASIDKAQNFAMEHVSVSIYNDKHKLPTWDEMCEVKDIFWRDDEEVHQIHPPKGQYIHGVGDMDNVLHLWRPVGGWDWEK